MIHCELCNCLDGEGYEGRIVHIEDWGVCDVCIREMKNREEMYRKLIDGDPIAVIPWPAFHGASLTMNNVGFNWPPYSEVTIQGSYMRGGFDFCVYITADSINATTGRRLKQVNSLMPLGPKELRTKEIEQQRQWTIPFDRIDDIDIKYRGNWMVVYIDYRRTKFRFFSTRKKWVKDKIYWKLSRVYDPAIDDLLNAWRRYG